jgi:hypothetical protein
MKNKFIESELWYLSLAGAFQRNSIYAKNINDVNGTVKKAFRLTLRNSVQEIAKRYNNATSDTEHIANIEEVIETNKNPILGNDGKLKFGTVQKLLNLYLKYLWCSDRISQPPPHCPVDSIILGHSKSFRNERWTQLDCPDQYMLYIEELRAIAKDQNTILAEWELDTFNRRGEQILDI